MKKIFSLLGLVCSFLILGQGIHFARDGFTPRRLQPFYQFMDGSSKLSLRSEVEEILSQPFYYLGRGRQCFAFQSKDGKYVLKLPRTDIHKLSFWVRSLPDCALKERVKKNHVRRRGLILDSFALAEQELGSETGTLAVHFGDLLSEKELILVDKLGITHHLPLESTFFALQEKHDSWTEAFLKSLKDNNREEAKSILSALSSMIEVRAKKGIVNRDRSFLRNYGYDGKRAVQIDIGSFYKPSDMHPRNVFEKSICDSFDPIESWLAKTDVEMQQHLLYLKKKLLTEFK